MAGTIRRVGKSAAGPTLGAAALLAINDITRMFGVLTPFLVWPIAGIMGFVLHQFWPDNMWVLAFISFMTIVFAVFGWYLTHDRKGLASEHMMVTILAYGTLFCLIDHMGWTKVTTFLMIFGVFSLCMSWSMRNMVRHHDANQGTNLDDLFDTVGIDGAKMHLKPLQGTQRKRMSLPWKFKDEPAAITDVPPATGKQRPKPATTKAEGKIVLTPGDTVDDLQKRTGALESAGMLPPGTFQITKNMDRANVADVIMSNPRALNDSLPYPGPSYVGGSIADTISVGRYQDGTEVEFDILGLQLQVMGMIGSGKSLGAGWSALAEIVTRHDAIVWGVDVTKGDQTLGPLRPALHRLATTPEDAMKLLADANALIKPRTDYLAKKGLGKWKKGCGLKYLVVWLEEVPDIVEALQAHERGELSGEDIWLKSVKAARSAGITFAWSLQRADAEQVPILARGQAAKWCFGVADSLEASFGLSKVQDNAGCEPENWGNRHPGKFFLDAPSIPEDKVPMPARAWYWGTDDKLIHEHALKYPASEREPDEVMRKVLGGVQGAESESTDIPEQESEEPEEVIQDSELDQEMTTDLDNDFNLAEAEPMPPVAARAVIRNWLAARSGQTVKNTDLVEVRIKTGYGRAWGYKVMGEFEASGLVRRIESDEGVSWVVTDNPEVLSQDD